MPACPPFPCRSPPQKLHPVLRRHGAGVGDVLLLEPMGPGRLQVAVLKAHTEASDWLAR
jgi:hypothetical protein